MPAGTNSGVSSSSEIVDTTGSTVVNEYIVLKPALGKGLGLFAAKDLAPGTEILTEKPLVAGTSRDHVLPDYYHRLVAALPLSDQAIYDSLREGTTTNPSKRARIWDCNAFTYHEHSLVYAHASRFNHSCVPNVISIWANDDGVISINLRVVSLVAKGDELTITYDSDLIYLPASARALRVSDWGFTCTCVACLSQARPIHDSRRELLYGISLGLRRAPSHINLISPEKAQRLLGGKPPFPPVVPLVHEWSAWYLLGQLMELEGVRDAVSFQCYVMALETLEVQLRPAKHNSIAALKILLEMTCAASSVLALWKRQDPDGARKMQIRKQMYERQLYGKIEIDGMD